MLNIASVACIAGTKQRAESSQPTERQHTSELPDSSDRNSTMIDSSGGGAWGAMAGYYCGARL